MKKLLSIVLAALMAVSLFTACGAKSETAAPAESQAAASDSTSTETAAPASSEASSDATSYTIGICNYVDDASLNQIVENIQTRLAAIGEEKGVTFNVEYDNCNADSNLMSQIISNFQADSADLLVAVNRAYNKSDYIPCIAWGRNARFVKNLQVGDKIALSGRIQSREYQKKLSEYEVKTMTAYEVSVSKLAAFDSAENFDLEHEFNLYSSEKTYDNDNYEI